MPHTTNKGPNREDSYISHSFQNVHRAETQLYRKSNRTALRTRKLAPRLCTCANSAQYPEPRGSRTIQALYREYSSDFRTLFSFKADDNADDVTPEVLQCHRNLTRPALTHAAVLVVVLARKWAYKPSKSWTSVDSAGDVRLKQ